MVKQCSSGIGTRYHAQHRRTSFAPAVKSCGDEPRLHSFSGDRCKLQSARRGPQLIAPQSSDRNSSHACMQATQIEASATTENDESKASSAAALICAPITAVDTAGVLKDIELAKSLGAEVVELRLDYQKDLQLKNPEPQLRQQLEACKQAGLQAIVTFRPTWEGGKFDGEEAVRLAILKFSCAMEPAYVDVELLAADFFFAAGGAIPISTNIILSHHDYGSTPSDGELDALVTKMFQSGADIAKVASTATDITDAMRMLALPGRAQGPVIALAMGERGLASRLLASKFGAHLTFGALAAGRGSAPGQPTLQELRDLYRIQEQRRSTQIYGVIGNPVSHSRSPVLHNAAFRQAGIDAVYIPLLVDSLPAFLSSTQSPDFRGFSVTIPHKLAALEAANEVDPVAAQIGAVNTLVRRPEGGFTGYNSDWSAAINAVEECLAANAGPGCDPEGCVLDFGAPEEPSSSEPKDTEPHSRSPLSGQRVVVLGAGGAARALAFGAASRGACVVVTNRSRQRAEELVASLGSAAEVAELADVAAGRVGGYVLLNTTSVGMHPDVDATPVSKAALGAYRLVFDAVYTPINTQLLKDARESGCLTVDGLEMFVGQAAQQFKLFTGQEAPLDTIRHALSI